MDSSYGPQPQPIWDWNTYFEHRYSERSSDGRMSNDHKKALARRLVKHGVVCTPKYMFSPGTGAQEADPCRYEIEGLEEAMRSFNSCSESLLWYRETFQLRPQLDDDDEIGRLD